MLCASLLVAGCRSSSVTRPLNNECTEEFECADTESCDPELGRCVRARAEAPYDYALQVLTVGNGRGLVPRTFDTRRQLDQAVVLENPLRVRRAVQVTGQVIASLPMAMGERKPTAFEAELAFFPQNVPEYLAPALSVFTYYTNDGQTFTASLSPDTLYDVQVIPLGKLASENVPPRRFALDSARPPQQLTYPPLTPLRGRILPEMQPPPGEDSPLYGLRVRLQRKDDDSVVSSVQALDRQGYYELLVEGGPENPIDLSAHELVLDLFGESLPWTATLAIDGLKLLADGMLSTVTIPNIPSAAPLLIEVTARAGGRPVASDVTFVSTFQPPPGEPVIPGRDWCRLRSPGSVTFSCRAEQSVTVTQTTEVRLLPGHYQLIVRPSGGGGAGVRLATAQRQESVLPQRDGEVQGPVRIELDPALTYQGKIVSPLGEVMPQVTLTATALNLPDRTFGLLAAYNRSSETVSNRRGVYQLPVDVGSYDLVATAPEGTGFPSYCAPNRFLSPSDPANVDITFSSPVVAQGRVVDEQGSPVFPARVEAFAIVEDESGERALRIARAESNDAGQFVLYMPSRIEDGKRAPVLSMDGGVELDARVQPLRGDDAAAQR